MRSFAKWKVFGTLILIAGSLNFFFMNCSRNFGVSNQGSVVSEKIDSTSGDNSGQDTTTGQNAPTSEDGQVSCPPGSTAPECELSDDVGKIPDSDDPDSDVEKMRQKFCTPFEVPDANGVQDLKILDERGKKIFKQDIGNLEIDKFRGVLVVHHANHLYSANDIRGATILRSPVMEKVSDIRGLTALMSSVVGKVENYRGGLCVGAKEVQSLMNGRGFTLVMGPQNGKGMVETIEDVKGTLLLVNVDVKTLNKVKGVVFVKNATIENSTNSNVKIVELKKKK